MDHTKGRGLYTESSTTISGRTSGYQAGDLFGGDARIDWCQGVDIWEGKKR